MDDDRHTGIEAADGTGFAVGTEAWRGTPDMENSADLLLDGESLTIDAVVNVARRTGTRIGVTSQAARRLHQSRELKLRILKSGQAIYGVTTGFGDSVTRQVSAEKASELQRNLIRYHLNGTGSLVPLEMVRATLLIRANCLARGNSGVNPAVVSGLANLIEHDVVPCIPERGSVGASGDLVPLCHLAVALIGEGQVSYRGEIREAADVLPEIGVAPLELEAKDGLGLINGTAFSAAFAVMSAWAARRLAVVADLCTALASEATLGNRSHFHAFIHQQKPHAGQRASARFIAGLLDDSHLALEHSQVAALNDPLEQRGYQRLRRSIQDRYSIRCAPHVTGVLRDTLSFVESWIETEINSSNDNPLFDIAEEQVHSGGNFYGGHVAQAMDALKIATASVADLLDRQVELMVDEKFNNGLTPNLIPRTADHDWDAGLHHGFKGMQIACSAITAEALEDRHSGQYLLPLHGGPQPGQGQHVGYLGTRRVDDCGRRPRRSRRSTSSPLVRHSTSAASIR